MNTLIDIVNKSKHPIDSNEYIQDCNDEIKSLYSFSVGLCQFEVND